MCWGSMWMLEQLQVSITDGDIVSRLILAVSFLSLDPLWPKKTSVEPETSTVSHKYERSRTVAVYVSYTKEEVRTQI
jgi:hypothetical protein